MTKVIKKMDTKWLQQYEKLVEFQQKNGHCLVPKVYEQDKAFGLWVRTQRNVRTHNKLRQKRKELLNEIGFVWKVDSIDVQDKKWNLQYERLVEFQRKNGDCFVSHSRYTQDKSLGHWVSNQRHFHAKNKMRQDRKDLLDKIRFVWRLDGIGVQDNKWHQQYKRLVDLKQKNGICMVPQEYEQDKPLEHWVSRQRHFHAKNKMRQDRKDLLDEIGFVWKVDSIAARTSTTDDVIPIRKEFTSSVGLPTEAIEETEPAQGPARNPSQKPSPANSRKRPRTCLAESGKIVAS